jgi:hypothetical protein
MIIIGHNKRTFILFLTSLLVKRANIIILSWDILIYYRAAEVNILSRSRGRVYLLYIIHILYAFLLYYRKISVLYGCLWNISFFRIINHRIRITFMLNKSIAIVIMNHFWCTPTPLIQRYSRPIRNLSIKKS